MNVVMYGDICHCVVFLDLTLKFSGEDSVDLIRSSSRVFSTFSNNNTEDFGSEDIRHHFKGRSDEISSLIQELTKLKDEMKQLVEVSLDCHQLELRLLQHPQAVKYSSETETCDLKLENVLRKLQMNDHEIQQFALEGLTYEDIMNSISLDELKELRIRLGPRHRLWTFITEHRGSKLVT
jgi:hypothetical protein